jgi:hypothetical protein
VAAARRVAPVNFRLVVLGLLGKVLLAEVVRIYLVGVAAALALLALMESVELVEQEV